MLNLFSGWATTLPVRPLDVSVVTTWQEHRSDKCYFGTKQLYLSVISVLSHSVLVLVFLPYLCVTLTFSASATDFLFHYSHCPSSLSLQLRIVRYGVPLVMFGWLYYKVWHFLGVLCSLGYIGVVITEPSQFETNCKRKIVWMEENDNWQLDHNRIAKKKWFPWFILLLEE